ncbi:MAG: hypothetical protein AVDCRST_MAG03-2331 [uncultured Rubrobacteraceae bacterium]|uniref:HTH araC/xylS-type domain-containing protein n=1 Tax=uncultured Rubrobacteraceae bacterium TaxID=349277 RepID=A0A6J4PNT9_9ACTN|nr:MAG: hypothetical protein AVDCRST_MAG03-2331 [uncultured Rubrobacteraceae bacterium]
MGTRHDVHPGSSPVSLREAGPDGIAFQSDLASFGGVEVRRHLFPPGEAEVAGFGGHLVTLHLGNPTRGLFRQGEISAEVTEGRDNVMVVPAGVPAYQALFDPSEAANVLLDARLLGRLVEEGAGGDPGRVEVIGSFGDRDPRAAGIMRAFLLELESGGRAGGALYVGALAQELAVHLLRYHSSLGRRGARHLARRETVGLSKKELGTAVDFIEGNLSRDFSLSEVAGAVGLSTHHFARLFRLSTGLAPHQYAVRRRAERARDLLLGGSPPGLAAMEAGFYDQSHLGRHFKRLFGTTPKRALEESAKTGKNVL